MSGFRADGVQLVKDAADIVEVIGEHVALQRRGNNFLGLCPFHGEKTPSFTVSNERGLFHCFGCKESGDVISFMMKYHNLTFPDALQELAKRYGITLEERQLTPQEQERAKKKQQLIDINEKAAALFHLNLLENPGAAGARQYLVERRIPDEVIREFRLGYAPDSWDFLIKKLGEQGGELEHAIQAGLVVRKDDGKQYDRFRHRLLCPIFNMAGQVVGFGGRILGDGQPKYLNSPESLVFDKSATLYGLYQGKGAVRRAHKCLVVEGNFDLLAMAAEGMGYVAAPLGTALTQKHVHLLKRYAPEVVLLFDGDAAGVKAATRSVTFFLKEHLAAKVALLPPEHDPDTYLKEFGQSALIALVDQALPLPEFFFGRLVAEYGLDLVGKEKIVRELQPLLRAMAGDDLQRTVFLAHFSEKLGISVNDLSRFPIINKKEKRVANKREVQGPIPLEQRRLLEFLLFFPSYSEDFFSRGLAQICNHAGVSEILAKIKILAAEDFSPEMLLTELDPALHGIVTEILVSPPSCLPEKSAAMAEDIKSWIDKKVCDGKKNDLVAQIEEAHQANNLTLMMELIEKKKELDEVSRK